MIHPDSDTVAQMVVCGHFGGNMSLPLSSYEPYKVDEVKFCKIYINLLVKKCHQYL